MEPIAALDEIASEFVFSALLLVTIMGLGESMSCTETFETSQCSGRPVDSRACIKSITTSF